eukprot:763404-Hanusia_phi.AAC.1
MGGARDREEERGREREGERDREEEGGREREGEGGRDREQKPEQEGMRDRRKEERTHSRTYRGRVEPNQWNRKEEAGIGIGVERVPATSITGRSRLHRSSWPLSPTIFSSEGSPLLSPAAEKSEWKPDGQRMTRRAAKRGKAEAAMTATGLAEERKREHAVERRRTAAVTPATRPAEQQ